MKMGKKKKKNKHSKNDKSINDLSSVQILQKLKSMWLSCEWQQSLNYYNLWIKKTGKKIDNQVYGEILLRNASVLYQKGQSKQALEYLEKALVVDPDNKNRYKTCQAIIKAWSGNLDQDRKVFDELNSNFYKTVFSYLINTVNRLPKEISFDFAIEPSMILQFWNELIDNKCITTLNPALRNIGEAFKLFSRGEDPSQKLYILKKSTGYNVLAWELSLLCAVSRKQKIKVRHLINESDQVYRDGEFTDYFIRLIEIHLVYLLRERDFNELLTLYHIFLDTGFSSKAMDKYWDEMFFNLGLNEVYSNNFNNALNYFLKITESTSAILHNMAFCYQKLEKYEKANTYWLELTRREKKPKQKDDENRRQAFAVTMKYIAQNYKQIGNLEKAFFYLKEVISILKDDKETIEQLYSLADQMDKKQESFYYAKRLYQMEPDNLEYIMLYTAELKNNNQIDTIIPIFKDTLKKDPGNNVIQTGLDICYLDKAWKIRSSEPILAKELIHKLKNHIPDHPKLHYLNGHFLSREGEKEKANKEFKKAIDSSRYHEDDYELGIAFYEDGRKHFSIKFFKRIVFCNCDISSMFFEKSVKFLCHKGDKELACLVCDYAVKRKKYSFYDIADMLLDYKKPDWALKYSSELVSQEEADMNDMFLHLILLSEAGNKDLALKYSRIYQKTAEENGDWDEIMASKEIVKEIKTRGRFKWY